MLRSSFLALLGALFASVANTFAYTINEGTWSVPVPSLEDRRAYL